MSSNRASYEGTESYRIRFAGRAAPNHFRQQQGLTLSSVGIGTYLGDADETTDLNYTNAVVRAVQLGANVIDSAANYRFQRSERSIGDALKTLAGDHGFAREELLICTKGGYLPFDSSPPRNVREYVEETFVKPGIASFEDFVGMHCMTPGYLQNQLDQSLRNMGVECVDVYYIHNPESQLAEVPESEVYERLRLAFERLEEKAFDKVEDAKLRAFWQLVGDQYLTPEALSDVACERDTAPYVARGLMTNRILGETEDGLRTIAARMRSGRENLANCPGVEGFTNQDWAGLDELSPPPR